MGKKRSTSDNNNSNIDDTFDLTLGRYEICKLICIINQKDIGFYRGNVLRIVFYFLISNFEFGVIFLIPSLLFNP